MQTIRVGNRSHAIPETSTGLVDALDQATIAGLPAARISEMDRDELVRVVRAARMPFLTGQIDEHLAFRDRQTLIRLANLARRCCHNRMTTLRMHEGLSFREEEHAGLVTPAR